MDFADAAGQACWSHRQASGRELAFDLPGIEASHAGGTGTRDVDSQSGSGEHEEP